MQKIQTIIWVLCLTAVLGISLESVHAQNPSWHWATNIGDRGPIPFGNNAENIGCDAQGRSYLINSYGASAHIGSVYLNNATPVIVWTRTNSNGYIDAVKELKGLAGVSTLSKMIVDPSGNTIVVGNFTGTVTIESIQLNAQPGANALFIAKYDRDGALSWVKTIGGDDVVYIYKGAASDSSGNVYVNLSVKGHYAVIASDTVRPGNVLAMPVTIKMDRSGSIVWHRELYPANSRPGDVGIAEAFSIAADEAGNVYMGGARVDTLFLDAQRAQPVPGNFSRGRSSFIAKYDSDGRFIWAKDVPFRVNFSLAAGDPKSFLIYGLFGADSLKYDDLRISGEGALLLKCDSSGKGVWSSVAYTKNNYTDFKHGIGLDRVGNIYTLGKREDTLSSDSMLVEGVWMPLYKDKYYLLKRSPSGAISWSYSFKYETITEMTANNNGDVFVNGEVYKVINRQQVADTLGSIVINPDGRKTSFWAKFTEQRPTGINNRNVYQRLFAFPNPSTGRFTVHLNGASSTRLTVTDQLGRVVYQQETDPGAITHSFDLGNAAVGIYYLKRSGNGASQTQKLILAR